MKLLLFSLLSAAAVCSGFAQSIPASTPRLKVSDNHRFLVRADGSPFFYLGDTAWELFHRLTCEEATQYLENRAKLGFNVVQAVAIAELDGHADPNAYGHLPLNDLDPGRPAVTDGPANDYWDHVDFIVDKANSLGITVGFLPTWGRYWHDKIKEGKPLFTRENAATYGEWLGQRYKDKGIIWIVGGDRGLEDDEQKEIIRAMARGLRKGDGGTHLITLHPPGGAGSAQWFHNEEWLDFNMRQNGHSAEFTGHYDQTRVDYERTPTKPVIDGEPLYEDHPVSFNAKQFGHSIAADVRRPLYWDLFGGAAGHTYGNHAVWQMWQPGRGPINNPLMPWTEAINQPGAAQMQHAVHLLESRPYLSRVPDDSLIVETKIPTAMPGAGTRHFAATRDTSGSYAMIYAPVGRPFKVRMDRISGTKITAWWFDPRTGQSKQIGEFPNTGEHEFIHPAPGEALDWVLVLDDASRNFPAPGRKTSGQ
ncbi:MAG: putative endoglucanase [Chthoniobacteraceae bacterium]|nr:putative endoglucanase [Chthoniobacteraceae bacterium]